MNNSFLYRHVRLDTNEVFYVGIGKGRNYQRAKTHRFRNIWWQRIVSKTAFEIEIILDKLSMDEACKKEKEFILLYGRKDLKTGTLVNLTEGGEGVTGVIVNDEMRANYRAGAAKRLSNPKERQRMAVISVGRIPYNKGSRLSDSQKEKMKAAALKRWTPEWNVKMNQAIEKKRNSVHAEKV